MIYSCWVIQVILFISPIFFGSHLLRKGARHVVVARCGLLGFDCRCGYTFCGKCRHAEAATGHCRSFHEMGRKQLETKVDVSFRVENGQSFSFTSFWFVDRDLLRGFS